MPRYKTSQVLKQTTYLAGDIGWPTIYHVHTRSVVARKYGSSPIGQVSILWVLHRNDSEATIIRVVEDRLRTLDVYRISKHILKITRLIRYHIYPISNNYPYPPTSGMAPEPISTRDYLRVSVPDMKLEILTISPL